MAGLNIYKYHTQPNQLARFYDVLDFMNLGDVVEDRLVFDYFKQPEHAHKITEQIEKIIHTDYLSPIQVEPGVVRFNTRTSYKIAQLYRLSSAENKQIIIKSFNENINKHIKELMSQVNSYISLQSYLMRAISGFFDEYGKEFLAQFKFPELQKGIVKQYLKITDIEDLANKFDNIKEGVTPEIKQHVENILARDLNDISLDIRYSRYDQGIVIHYSNIMDNYLKLLSLVNQKLRKQIITKFKQAFENAENVVIQKMKEHDVEMEHVLIPARTTLETKVDELNGYEVFKFEKLRKMAADRYHQLNDPSYRKEHGIKYSQEMLDQIKQLVKNMQG